MRRILHWAGLGICLFLGLTRLGHSQGSITFDPINWNVPPDSYGTGLASNLYFIPPSLMEGSFSNSVGDLDGTTFQIIPGGNSAYYDYAGANQIPYQPFLLQFPPLFGIPWPFNQPTITPSQFHPRLFVSHIRPHGRLFATRETSHSWLYWDRQLILMEVNREQTAQQVISGDLPPLPPTGLTPIGQSILPTPEPTTLGLLLMAAGLALAGRRKKSVD